MTGANISPYNGFTFRAACEMPLFAFIQRLLCCRMRKVGILFVSIQLLSSPVNFAIMLLKPRPSVDTTSTQYGITDDQNNLASFFRQRRDRNPASAARATRAISPEPSPNRAYRAKETSTPSRHAYRIPSTTNSIIEEPERWVLDQEVPALWQAIQHWN